MVPAPARSSRRPRARPSWRLPLVPPEQTHAVCQRAPGPGGFLHAAPLCYDRAMPPRRRRRGLRAIVALLLLALAGWLAWEWWRWPDVAALARKPPATT